MDDILDLVSLSMWGPGILVTTVYPNPFPIAQSGANMNLTVGNGIGFDTVGKLTAIRPGLTGSPIATPAVGDATHPRWDLLVIEYAQVGDTPVPKPSDPLTTIELNLHDDFLLRIITGTPSGSPAYPSYTGSGFILAGVQVPANATLATQCAIDLSQAQYSRFGIAQQPIFVQEQPTGTVDGSNTAFTTSQNPITNGSLKVYLDGVKQLASEYSFASKTITFTVAPAIGQVIWVDYVAESPNSQNPVQGVTETPDGVVDGTNATFALSAQPIYQAAVEVYVDGLFVDPTTWSLESSNGAGAIVFNSGEQPLTGQTVEVQYWKNTWPNNTSGGGGGSKEVHGTFAAPISINPTVGIQPTFAMDQTWYCAPAGSGAQPITSTPAIQPGTIVGQVLTLKGVDPDDYLQIPNALVSGTRQNGACNLTDNQAIEYEWDGAAWNENTRRS